MKCASKTEMFWRLFLTFSGWFQTNFQTAFRGSFRAVFREYYSNDDMILLSGFLFQN